MKITIGGLSCTGTSSVGRLLADRLFGGTYRSVGDIRRATVAGLDQIVSCSADEDRLVDEATAEFGRTNDNFVCEGRLAWRQISDSWKILLTCRDDVRARRYAADPRRECSNVAEALRRIRTRDKADIERLRRVYGIMDFTFPVHYDLVISVTALTVEQVVHQIVEFLSARERLQQGVFKEVSCN